MGGDWGGGGRDGGGMGKEGQSIGAPRFAYVGSGSCMGNEGQGKAIIRHGNGCEDGRTAGEYAG